MKQKKKLVIGSKQRVRKREKKIEEVVMHLDRKQPVKVDLIPGNTILAQALAKWKQENLEAQKEQDDSRS